MNGKANEAPGGSGGADSETEITLGVLDAVHENEKVTQRSVARDLGIALGLANAYLKRCVRKGLIKVNQIPPNRYLYYLTPKGFSEKSRLTAEYLSSSMTFFRRAREQCEAILQDCLDAGWSRVALLGSGELAEIAILCNAEFKLDLIVVDPDAEDGARLAGVAVERSLPAPGKVDAVIVTDMTDPQGRLTPANRQVKRPKP
jgi:DNA-binding MarR family transcriptional regulator